MSLKSALIKCADQQTFLYVDNLRVDAAEDGLSKFLTSKFPTKFTVEQLPKKNSAKSSESLPKWKIILFYGKSPVDN